MFFLSESEVERVVALYGANFVMDRLIDGIREGFKSIARGEIIHHARTGFFDEANLIEWMPVRNGSDNVVVKIVSYCPANPEKHAIPTIGAVVSRVDWRTGQISEVLGGRLLTAMRTGAASAVATQYLAPSASTTLGLIGCGLQAVTQAHAICRVLPIKRLIAYDIDVAALASLSRRLSLLSITVHAADVDEIERNSDVICTATTIPVGGPPVLSGRLLQRHVHINAIGSDFPGKIELPPTLTRSSFVAADCIEQARVEGECQSLSEQQLISPRCIELQTVLASEVSFGHLRDERTIFDSTGIAMEDAVALELICGLARKAGIGRDCPIAAFEDDPRDPYSRVFWSNDVMAAAANESR